MKQTGELLKSARENAKLSLSEVALSTKINPKILAAIENGDRQSLPALTFLKGFLRSYALFLKLDPEDVMKVFNAESGIQAPAPPVAAAPTPTPAEPPRAAVEAPTPASTPITKRRVDDSEGFKGLRALAVAVIVVLIGVIIGVRELVEKYQREKVVDTVAEMKVNPLPQKKEEAKKEEAKKEEPVEVAKTDTKAELKAEVKAEAKAEPQPQPEPQPPKALAALPEEPKKEEPKKEEPKKEDVPEVKPASIVKSIKSEIILEALDKVEVKFKVHGEAKRVSLGPTQVHTIFADEPMILDVSDGGALNIILNGRERGVPGDLGKPAQVKIP